MPSYGTQCFDNLRTGWNPQEYALRPDSMRQKTLCNLGSCVVAGQVYAQPLVVENIALPDGRVGDFLLVATQENWIYAFDTLSLSQVWARQLLPAGEHLVSASDLQSCDNVSPSIGITSTPVLDPERRLMYVCAKSKKPGGFLGSDSYHHRLYAINLHTGGDWKPPVEVSATIHYGGKTISFNPQWQLQRPGLLLMNQTVYLAFGSHCDAHPGDYHGCVLAYDANTLGQVGAFVSTVSGLGGIWQSGRGLAGDGQNVYCQTGNGPWGGLDLGDSVLKLSRQASPLLQLNGFFTPCDQQMLRDGDVDLGSGGPMLLPDQPGPFPHLMVAAGKEGTVYLLNPDTSLGGFVPPSPTWKPCDDRGRESPCANSNIVVSTLWMVLGQAPRCDVDRDALFGGPAYYEPAQRPGRPRIYYCGGGPMQEDVVRAFEYNSTSGRLVGPVEQSTNLIQGGAIPVVSSNGGEDGILWVASRGGGGLRYLYAYDLSPSVGLGDPRALLADLQVASYSAEGDGTPSLGPPATVVNGRVYVGCDGQVVVFGLLNRMAVNTTSEVPGRSISLMVTDATTGAPIVGAVVTIDEGSPGTTDAHGSITLRHRPCREFDGESHRWLPRECNGRVHKDGYCDEEFTTEIPRQ